MAIKKTKKGTAETDSYQNAESTGNSSSGNKKAPFAVVEAYKTIRTNLLFVLAQNDGKAIALSSSSASEGKSTTSVNISIAFSQLGGKVLLLDGDLRRSSIHKKLHLENTDGLSNVLAGFSSFEKAVHSVNENMDVLTAGPIPPNPSELLGSKQFVAFMEMVREKYDYIFVDTPPIKVVSDALVIAPQTDGLLLVVRDGFTPHDAIQRAIDAVKFANINLLGSIMNGVNPKSAKRYTYRKYSYGYKYSKYGYGGGYGSYGYDSYGKSYGPEND